MSRWADFRDEIIKAINIKEFYSNNGVKFAGGTPSSQGWLSCYSAFGSKDTNPSAGVNLNTGIYKDFRTGNVMSIFDFLVEKHVSTSWWEAARTLAKSYNVKLPRRTEKHPEDGVEWQTWAETFCLSYCRRKPGVTPQGLKASGAVMCTRYGVACFAWPMLDARLFVMGWVFVPRNGLPFEKNKAPSIIKKFDEHESGLIGTPALRKIELERDEFDMYWCEGITDMLALYSQWPEAGAFVTNGGCSEGLTKDQFELVKDSRIKLHLICDADLPGLRGYEKRLTQLREKGKDATFHCPPYPVQKEKGKDIRDWLQEKQYDEHVTYQQLLVELADQQTAAARQDYRQQDVAARITQTANRKEKDEQLLSDLGMEMLQSDIDGCMLLECHATRKRRKLKTITLSWEDYLAVGGYQLEEFVINANEDEARAKGKVSFAEFRRALSRSASTIENKKVTTIGNGIWHLQNQTGEGNYYLVSDGEFYEVRNGTLLTTNERVIHGKYITDLEKCVDWCNTQKLKEHMEQAQLVNWRRNVHDEFFHSVKSWVWTYDKMDLVAAGLFYASWVQTILPWRPIVLLQAESEAGKTQWLKFLADLYQDLATPFGLSTTAGVIQSIGLNGTPVLIDELDAKKDQSELFKVLRATGAGQVLAKGTSNHEGKIFRLCHIPWIGGICAATEDAPDMNRMIQLGFDKSAIHTFDRPCTKQARELGLKLLACVLVCLDDILDIYDKMTLRELGQPRVDRFVESYSVPYATICAILGYDYQVGVQLRDRYFNQYLHTELATKNLRSDQHLVLDEILSTPVQLPGGSPLRRASVAQILMEPVLHEYLEELRPGGMAIKHRKQDKITASHLKHPTADMYIAFDIQALVHPSGILGRSRRWSGNVGVGEVLKRLADLKVFQKNVRVSGPSKYCICFPYLEVLKYLQD